jgi:hypothetical protein
MDRDRQIEARRLHNERTAAERRTEAPRRRGVVVKARARPKFQPPQTAPGISIDQLRAQGGYGRRGI